MWSTPSDLARFVIDLQQSPHGQSNRVLTAAMVRQMLVIQISNWALGIAIDSTSAATCFAHGGASIGFRSALVGSCTTGQGAVAITSGERGDHLYVEILHSLVRACG